MQLIWVTGYRVLLRYWAFKALFDSDFARSSLGCANCPDLCRGSKTTLAYEVTEIWPFLMFPIIFVWSNAVTQRHLVQIFTFTGGLGGQSEGWRSNREVQDRRMMGLIIGQGNATVLCQISGMSGVSGGSGFWGGLNSQGSLRRPQCTMYFVTNCCRGVVAEGCHQHILQYNKLFPNRSGDDELLFQQAYLGYVSGHPR
jgi:hypothetical protein